MNRRDWLKVIGAAVPATWQGTACLVRKPRPPALAQVNVSADRVIRTVAGLRPFRPSGFVLRREELGPKTIIHNYGHGGCGVTLSWGTDHLAVEEALKTNQTKYAVLGCGAVGLATARLLQRRGFEVTIYAKDPPPNTTSNIAGALWGPVGLFDSDKLTPEFLDQLTRAARLSNRYFQDLVGDYYGVLWIDIYLLGERPDRGEGLLEDVRVQKALGDLFHGPHTLSQQERPFAFNYVYRYVSMLIEPPIYLNAVLRDFLLAGDKVVVREFADLRAVSSLPQPVIMNCTGLGAKALFNDEELTPIKGQLSILLPQPEVTYTYMNYMSPDDLYMFPRRDGVLLGGTFERGVWSLEPSPVETERILKGHAKIMSEMRVVSL